MKYLKLKAEPFPLAVIKGVPAGYSRTTTNGVAVTFNGKPVYDNGKEFFVRA